MGRGNVCVNHECEGLYYLDRDLLDEYRKVVKCTCGKVTGFDFDTEPMTVRQLNAAGIEYDFDGTHSDWAYDEVQNCLNWKGMISRVTEGILKRFKSFRKVERWRGSRHIVLESEFFEIAVVDGEWCAAWCLLEREDVDDVGRNRTLMRRHYLSYLEAIKQILLDGWGEAIGYGGAWVSGEVYKKSA